MGLLWPCCGPADGCEEVYEVHMHIGEAIKANRVQEEGGMHVQKHPNGQLWIKCTSSKVQ